MGRELEGLEWSPFYGIGCTKHVTKKKEIFCFFKQMWNRRAGVVHTLCLCLQKKKCFLNCVERDYMDRHRTGKRCIRRLENVKVMDGGVRGKLKVQRSYFVSRKDNYGVIGTEKKSRTKEVVRRTCDWSAERLISWKRWEVITFPLDKGTLCLANKILVWFQVEMKVESKSKERV